MHKLFLKPSLHPHKTEIVVGQDWLQAYLAKHRPWETGETGETGGKGAILADRNVAKQIGSPLQKVLGTGFDLIEITPGEASKTREEKERLEDELLKRKHGRDTLLIALGGGVATDLAGFIASTYMRGVPLILIPTSLLAMVDAAIGGKTGVDTPYGKNQIGTFYFPKAIWIDTAFLKPLPEIEWSNGLAEIAKYGLILEPKLWDRLEKAPDWKEPAVLESLILASIQTKIKVVEEDPLEEKGFRRIVNFGHTIGHALELLSNYKLPHGQAVAIGSIAESVLSHQLGYLSKSDLDRILALYKRLPFDLKWPSVPFSQLLQTMAMDKKAKSGEIRCVLIERIGQCVPFNETYCCPIKPDEFEKTFHWMSQNF